MTVRYKTLTVENFGPYYGEETLQFAPSGQGTPVTLVDGKNGYGKTTLLKAFRWLLYGADNREEGKKVVNKTAVGEGGKTQTKVELSLQRNGEAHTIIRSMTAPDGAAASDFTTELLYLVNGEPQGNPTSKIRELLPEPASQFFFFDGARISRYADMENSQEVRDAIELVLGIPAYENAANHLGRLRRRWEKKARQAQSKEKETRELAREVEDLEDEESRLEETLEDIKDERREREDRKEEVLAEYKKYDGLKDRISKIQTKEAELARHRDALEEAKTARAKRVRTAAQRAVLPLLRESLEDKRERYQELQSEREEYTGPRIVQDFLDRVEEEADSPEVRQAIPQIREYIDAFYEADPSEVDDQELAELQVEIGRLEEKIQQIEQEGSEEDVGERYTRARARVAQHESELKTLRRNLGDLDEEHALELQQELEEINQSLGSIDERIKEKQEELKEYRERLRTKKRELSSRSTSSEASKYEDLAERAGDFQEAFDTVIDLVRNQKRSKIETHATEIFRRLTRKPDVYDEFRINDDYTLSLLDHRGIEHPRDQISAGEKQLVALSFIVGLMQSTDRVAPLVIDVPFGHLDQLHRKNVIENLPEIDQQMVFMITDADVSEEHEPLLNRYVGKKYVIQYDSKQQTSSLQEVKA